MRAPDELVLGEPKPFTHHTVDVRRVIDASGGGGSSVDAFIGGLAESDPALANFVAESNPALVALVADGLTRRIAGSGSEGSGSEGLGSERMVAHPIRYGLSMLPERLRQFMREDPSPEPLPPLRGTCVVVPGILGADSASHLVGALARDHWIVVVVWPPLVDRTNESLAATSGRSASERGAALGEAIDEAIESAAEVACLQLVFAQSMLPELRGKPVILIGESMGAMAAIGLASTGVLPYDAALFVAGGGGLLDVVRASSLRGILFAGVPLEQEGFRAGFEEACSRDPLRCAGALRGGPIAVVTAEADAIVPARTQEALWKALGEPPRFVWSGGHLGLFMSAHSTIVPVARQLAGMLGERSRAVDVLFRFGRRPPDEPAASSESMESPAAANERARR